MDQAQLPDNIPTFYKEILTHWFSLKEEPNSIEEIHRQVLWNNKFIQIDNKVLFSSQAYINNIIYINDIVDEIGNFLPFNNILTEYGNCMTKYFYMSSTKTVTKGSNCITVVKPFCL